MAPEPALLTAIHILQNPIPQYVLGTLPAIAIMGTTPRDKLSSKLSWVLRCLGCPFTGLFYFCNIGNSKVEMSAYWLKAENFIQHDDKNKVNVKDDEDEDNEDNINDNYETDEKNIDEDGDNEDEIEENIDDNDGNNDKNNEENNDNNKDKHKIEINEEIGNKDKQVLIIRPVGHHVKELNPTPRQEKILKNWVAEATLLDRLASLVSAYYILVGIFAGISKAAGPCMEDNSLEDWPFIPLLFIWTLPVIYVRIKNGKIVDRMEPDQINKIPINDLKDGLHDKQKRVALTALASVALPWLAVIIAYYTRPIGFFCRSKFLTIICSIWSFNNIVAYISHVRGEKDIFESPIYIWFEICGYVMSILLVILSLLANTNSWWVSLFGPSCDAPLTC